MTEHETLRKFTADQGKGTLEERRQAIIDNIEHQTELTFRIEKRTFTIWKLIGTRPTTKPASRPAIQR